MNFNKIISLALSALVITATSAFAAGTESTANTSATITTASTSYFSSGSASFNGGFVGRSGNNSTIPGAATPNGPVSMTASDSLTGHSLPGTPAVTTRSTSDVMMNGLPLGTSSINDDNISRASRTQR